ncbi:hypothetical protein BCR33DRAFT_784392 [Rhizoclosmatium globosum]|uniref:Uncharacterized protein n=1 Tax=Rhizoclosmatium globosum TaxID=329046 RepID=A0A1Y2CF30_9FUNG|nr:hypothetical protein BCR33DRAFT_784392 [Rhizoclosmatium globosum]|eukprot:ORY45639.1 hypothetical protein BCR33DRAFT_784392 [Rhizoclosmatium globosum]
MLDLDVLAAKIAGQRHNFGGKPVNAQQVECRCQIMYKEILPKLNGGNKVFGIPDTPEALAHSVRSRVVQLDSSPIWYRLVHILTPAWVSKLFGQGSVPTALIKTVFLKGSVQNKALFGPAFVHNKVFSWSYNDPTSRRSESPSFNGLTNARTMARIAELVRRS